ncbi:serine aminopeptidase domain-containing protein [Roseibium aggregatum]|uniref:serine aminopeptidase domain-containing protein n=1 Tax=Roseibium aggregatum TaxID=187304 RepID=UPI0025AC0C13|nr:alpha/beta hydrolase [Roseibium aggregatum]WJS05872.1 alpha/beta hydrolase [Roseibium aggregatum]
MFDNGLDVAGKMISSHQVTPEGVTLTSRQLEAVGEYRGTAFVSHGQAQHSLSLLDTLTGLAEKGWNVHATDLRGHGYSSGKRAPLAHMEINSGWESVVADFHLSLEKAFDGVDWCERMLVAPNISAPLALEVLKKWGDLARQIVFVAPPPNQPALMRMARSIAKVRSLAHPQDRPDDLLLYQLYSFLGAQLKDRSRLIDVVSSDQSITDELLANEYAWPTPTTGYFYEMFRGIEQAWRWPRDATVRPGTRILLLYGGDDPMTASGRFVKPMRSHFERMGVIDTVSYCVEGGRSGLIIEERRLGISRIIDDWTRDNAVMRQDKQALTANLGDVSSDILAKLGLENPDETLSADALVELCYNAINDENRWTEVLYRVAYAVSRDADLNEQQLESLVLALMPHWDRSYKLNRQIMQSAAVGAVLQNVIDRFDIGMAIVSDDLQVSYANDHFRTIICKMSDRAGNNAYLRDEHELTRRVKSLVTASFAKAVQTGKQEDLLVVEGEAVGFYFRPQALRQTALQRGGASGAIIVRDNASSDKHGLRSELLEFAYGLTTKEAEVACGVIDGLSPNDIAASLGVSIHTTRTHLKRVYEKVGVQGQTGLAARLLNGPIGLIAGR